MILGKLVILGKSEQDVRHILFTKTSALPLNRGLIKLHFFGFGSLFSISVVILNILLYYHKIDIHIKGIQRAN